MSAVPLFNWVECNNSILILQPSGHKGRLPAFFLFLLSSSLFHLSSSSSSTNSYPPSLSSLLLSLLSLSLFSPFYPPYTTHTYIMKALILVGGMLLTFLTHTHRALFYVTVTA